MLYMIVNHQEDVGLKILYLEFLNLNFEIHYAFAVHAHPKPYSCHMHLNPKPEGLLLLLTPTRARKSCFAPKVLHNLDP